MWIGLLYYFNVVQTPGLAAAAADKGGPGGAGVSKYIAPRALLWFRWVGGRDLVHGRVVSGARRNNLRSAMAWAVSGRNTTA